MKPILFNAEMALAVQQGRKTQIRRIMNIPSGWHFNYLGKITSKHPKQGKFGAIIRKGVGTCFPETDIIVSPYKIGEVIWVREPAKIEGNFINEKDGFKSYTKFKYKSDGIVDSIIVPIRFIKLVEGIGHFTQPKWMGMCQSVPNGCIKEMARTFLRVTNVRVERLNEISEDDAKAEGIISFTEEDGTWYHDYINGVGFCFKSSKRSFMTLWESISGKNSFDNRWVWVVEFKAISKEEATS